MLPIIHAKFRRRKGVPYSIEQISGRQYRCRHCNQVFHRDKDLDRHLEQITASNHGRKTPVSSDSPALSTTTEVRVLYTYDIKDRMQKRWLKLRKGDQYDGA